MNIIKDIDIFNHFNEYDVILLGTNTYCTLCNGLQHKVRLDYPEVDKANMNTKYGDPRKLGNRLTISGEPTISLCYITHGFNFRPDIRPDYLDYEALENCLRTANVEFANKRVATSVMGSSRFDGNGDKNKILEIFKECITRFDITIYDYFQKSREEELKEEWEEIVKWKDIDYNKFKELVKQRKEKANERRNKNGFAGY